MTDNARASSQCQGNGSEKVSEWNEMVVPLIKLIVVVLSGLIYKMAVLYKSQQLIESTAMSFWLSL